MMDIGSTELLMIIIVAIVVIGPKDLPRALYKVGQVVGKAKGVVRHFRTGLDAMVREVELEEMEKKWKADNERIMREYASAQAAAGPPASGSPAASSPAPAAPAPSTSADEPSVVMQPLAAPSITAAPPITAAPATTDGER